MKKIFFILCLLFLSSCDMNRLHNPITILNRDDSNMYIEACYYLEESLQCTFYHNNKFDLSENASNGIIYMPLKVLNVYKDKNKNNLLFTYTNEELSRMKKDAGFSLSSKDAVFIIDENGVKLLSGDLKSKESESCIRKKYMLNRHKNNSFLLDNKYSLYSNNTAQLAFNDTKIYLKKLENIYVGDIFINGYKVQFIPSLNYDEEKQKILQNYFNTLTNDILISDCDIKIENENDFKSLLFSDLIMKFSILMKKE